MGETTYHRKCIKEPGPEGRRDQAHDADLINITLKL